jgi:hypothetical protein
LDSEEFFWYSLVCFDYNFVFDPFPRFGNTHDSAVWKTGDKKDMDARENFLDFFDVLQFFWCLERNRKEKEKFPKRKQWRMR